MWLYVHFNCDEADVCVVMRRMSGLTNCYYVDVFARVRVSANGVLLQWPPEVSSRIVDVGLG